MIDEDDVDPETSDTEATDKPDNAADPKRISRRRRIVKADEQLEARFWQAILSGHYELLLQLPPELGRQACWNLIDTGHPFDERFAVAPNGAADPTATWINAGEQRVTHRQWLSWLRMAPEAAMVMLLEHDPRVAAARKPRSA